MYMYIFYVICNTAAPLFRPR